MNTKQLRQKILDLAIHGKLVSQDPADEPASVLLERVRTEKERLIKEGKIKRSKAAANPVPSDKSHYGNVPFEVPESWLWVQLSDLCEIVTGNTPSKQNKSYYGKDYPLYKPTDLDAGYDVITAGDMLSESGYEVSRKLPANTVLVTCIGATIGKTGLIRSEGSSNQQINAIIPHVDIMPEYIYFLCTSDFFQKQIHKNASATTLPIINKGSFEKLLFVVPPLAEQRRIVAAIESAFAVIDEIERNKTDLQATVIAAKQKILSLAIQGKLVPQDPADEPASVLLERIRAEREQLVKTGKIKRGKAEKAAPVSVDNSYYENLPAGWAVCRLDEVLDYEQPTQYIVESTAYSDEYSMPVLTAGKSFVVGYTNERDGICSDLPVIIFDDFTTDSRYVDFPFKVKSSAMKILRSERADIKYLYYFMQTVECNHTTHKRYWISDFSQNPLILPPLLEQHRIVSAIESAFVLLDNIAENLN